MEKTRKLYKNKVQVITRVSSINITCNVCNFCARDDYDLDSIQKEGACTECVQNFKYLDKDAWDRGERPSESVARKKMMIFIEEV